MNPSESSGSSTGGIAGGGPSPYVIGGTAESMQDIAQTVTAVTGLINTAMGLFSTGKNEKKREQQRCDEERRKCTEEQERKKNEDARQREMELINQRILAAEESSRELMADTKKSLEEDHQNFVDTKAIMEDTHQMEMNMVKAVAGATAKLYHDLGYIDACSENNGNQGVRLIELEAKPTSHQTDNMQSGHSMDEQGPTGASSVPQPPECLNCGSLTKKNFCTHFVCTKCHVKEEKIHCQICQRIYE